MMENVQTPTAATPGKEQFLLSLAGKSSALGDVFPALVENATVALKNIDFPTTRTEDWKYTRTTRISNEQWKIDPADSITDISSWLIPGLDAHVIVFVNGLFRPALSLLPASGKISVAPTPPANAVRNSFENIFQALAVAYATGTIHLHISKDAIVEKPVHLLHIVTGEKTLAQPHISIHAERSSEIHIIETFACTGKGKTFTNRTLHVVVEENAKLSVDKIQQEDDENFLLNDDNIVINENGRFTINTLTADGGWVRNSLNISLDGKNIEANLHGFYLPRKKQLVDNHTRVDHRQPHSNSNELYKGILNDQAIGVFNGKVYVQPDAQKTNAYQSNANIILSDDAQMNTKPELEIYADDVKCSHGTTTGQMDENALFYLKSRGLGDDSARRLLTTAFINDVLNKVEKEEVKNYVLDLLVKRNLLFT